MPQRIATLIKGAKELKKRMDKEREKRDRAVNNSRKKSDGSGSHVPNPRRGRKDILDELT